MQTVTLDFETYYDQDFSLRKLTTAEYIQDPRFHVHMVGIKIGNGQTTIAIGDKIEEALYAINWEESRLVGQNLNFDGFILAEIYAIYPAVYVDTRSMSQALYVGEKSHSLAAIADRLFTGWAKGDELADSKGVAELNGDLLTRISDYCKNDVELTYAAYCEMVDFLPVKELELIDLSARMFCKPQLFLDVERATASLEGIQKHKIKVIEAGGLAKTKLASNPQFAAWILANGMVVPKKESPTTGKETFALGKNDIGFQRLIANHPEHQNVWAARLEAKSTIAEKRTERFIKHAQVNGGRMPVPLNYYGAHTGRFSGRDKINFQNLQRGSELRKCLIAPEGYQLVVVDSSNIEARMLAWLAGQDELLDIFRAGDDVYAEMASRIYGFPVNKKDNPTERFVGKTAVLGLGYGMSAAKFRMTLATGAMGPRCDLSETDAYLVVKTYRGSNHRIVALWREMDRAILEMMRPSNHMRIGDLLPVSGNRIKLPSGLFLRYPSLRYNISGADDSHSYRRPEIVYGAENRLYGGKLTENVIQALARIVVCDQMLEIDKACQEVGGAVVLTVHDEVVAVVPDRYAEEMYSLALDAMRMPPAWAADLPLDAEGGFSREYSK